MRIGPYQLDSNTVVAPMAGVTDRPFRLLCRRFGAGLAVSEMLSADPALRATRKSRQRMDHDGEPAPVSVQIVGADPFQLAEAARRNVDNGAQIIDINMGCPAKKVCKVAAGSALLCDEMLVGRLLATVVGAVAVPVTLKMRTGWDPASRNGVRIAQIAEREGIAALAVHGRTRACAFSGPVEYDTIRAIRQAVSMPLIANGDIDSPAKAAAVLAHTGADAVMIGRAAQGRPWLFAEVRHYLATGELLPPPDTAAIRALVLEHLDLLHDFYGAAQGLRVARKHLAWYAHNLQGADGFRQRVNRAETTTRQRQIVAEFFSAPTAMGEQLAA